MENNPQEQELLPCPLCLHEAASFKTGGDRGIFCLNCGLRLNLGLPFNEIIERWNTRTAPDASTFSGSSVSSKRGDAAEYPNKAGVEASGAVMSAERFAADIIGNEYYPNVLANIKHRDASIRDQAIEECAVFIENHTVYPYLEKPCQPITRALAGKSIYSSFRKFYADGLRSLKTNRDGGLK